MMNNLKVLRGERVRNCKEEGALDFNSQQTAIRPGKIPFFSNEKEVKLCKNRMRKRKRQRERKEGGFFQRYYKISECSCYPFHCYSYFLSLPALCIYFPSLLQIQESPLPPDDQRTARPGYGAAHVARPSKDEVVVVFHGAANLPSLPDGKAPKAYCTL